MPDGLVLVDKPGGWTSHQVVGRLRRLLGTRKVGHAGTLDPMATGVLVVGVDRATRLLGHLALHDKRYLATMRLGRATSTDDAEGEPLGGHDPAHVTASDVARAAAEQRGEILQVPSAVSAIKVDGVRAYHRVRAGEDVQLQPRPVTVSRLDVGALRPGPGYLDVDLDIECSSGTYVRAIARDIGASLGVGGHLTALRRTRVGVFDLAGPHLTPAQLACDGADVPLLALPDAVRSCFPTVTVDADIARRVRFGQTVPVELAHAPTAIMAEDGAFLGLYRPDGEWARPVAVWAS